MLFLLLAAALLHAVWNAILKSGEDSLLSLVGITTAAGGIALVALPLLPAPAAASWGFIGASACLQILYYLMVAAAYRNGDISQAYPLMRGSAPLLVALASGPLLAEHLPPLRWLAIGTLCAGVGALVWHGRGTGRRATGWALATACVIALYTLVDAMGVRRSAAPAAYTLWIFLLTALPLLIWVLVRRRLAFVQHLRRRWSYGLLGGAGTLLSYGIALWAMTQAPVAMVAALRETSILFALLLARLFLGERISAARLAAILLIVAGVVLLRLS